MVTIRNLVANVFAVGLATAHGHADDLAAAKGLDGSTVMQGDEYGVLNPDELTLKNAIERASRGDVDMMVCAMGYPITKEGSHEEARIIFEECSRQGWTGTMTWLSYMEDNGLGTEENPERATALDRQAAEMGDPIAQLNYGLDLLRGRGVAPDFEAGKNWIDKAASAGEPAAQELQDADYDYTVVTPDADEWKYKKKLY